MGWSDILLFFSGFWEFKVDQPKPGFNHHPSRTTFFLRRERWIFNSYCVGYRTGYQTGTLQSMNSTLTRARSEPGSNTGTLNTIARTNVAYREDRLDERPVDVSESYLARHPSASGTLQIQRPVYHPVSAILSHTDCVICMYFIGLGFLYVYCTAKAWWPVHSCLWLPVFSCMGFDFYLHAGCIHVCYTHRLTIYWITPLSPVKDRAWLFFIELSSPIVVGG